MTVSLRNLEIDEGNCKFSLYTNAPLKPVEADSEVAIFFVLSISTLKNESSTPSLMFITFNKKFV